VIRLFHGSQPGRADRLPAFDSSGDKPNREPKIVVIATHAVLSFWRMTKFAAPQHERRLELAVTIEPQQEIANRRTFL